MTILSFSLNSNDETIWLDEPIENFEVIRMISCSLYNSWHNLKKRGEITVIDDKDVHAVNRIYPGYYDLQSIIGKEIKNILEKENIKVILGDERGSILIKNPGKKVIFDRELTYLLGLSQNNQQHTLKKGETINRLFSFNNMLISCDLVDKNDNFFNGKPSTVLACFDMRGLPYKREFYYSRIIPFRKIAGGKKVINSLRITVTEENGEVIDFNGLPLRFEFEII